MQPRNPRALFLRLPAALVLVAACLPAEEAPGAKTKGKAKASEPAPGEFSIEWDKQQLGEPDIIKRLYRLRKSNQWEESRLPRLTRMVIESGRPKLLPYGHYYQALIHGKDGDAGAALESIQKAVALGYANYVEIAGAEELALLLDMDEFKAIIEPLAAAFQKRVRESFEGRVDAAFAASAGTGGSPWAMDLKSRPDGGPFLQDKRPSIVVVTRIDHEGFEKLLPRVKKVLEDSGGKLAGGIVFYHEFPEDEARIARTDAYARRVGLEKIPHAIAGRDAYKAIVAALLDLHGKAQAGTSKGKKGKAADDGAAEESAPFHVYPLIAGFLDGEGALRHGACGVFEDWQLEYAARKLIEASPPAEAPKEEAPPPEEKEKVPEEKPPAGEPAKEEEKPSSEPEKASEDPEKVDEP